MASAENNPDLQPSFPEEDTYASKGVDYVPLRRSSHGQLIRFAQNLHRSSRLSNLTITCRGRSFAVHQFVLASQSSYFEKLIESEGFTSQLSVDFDPDILDLCLEYLYKGTVQIEVRLAGAVADMCGELGIVELRNACLKHIYNQTPITVDNCLDIFFIGVLTDDSNLIEKTQPIVLANFPLWHKSSSFSKLPYECVARLLSHPDLKVKAHDQRLIAALFWVKAAESHESDLLCLVKALPINSMNDWFLEEIMDDLLLKSKSSVCQFLREANPPQHGVIIIGAGGHVEVSCQNAGRDVHALVTSLTKPSKMITTIPSTVPDNGYIACCMNEGVLWVSGVGEDGREVLKFDTETNTWSVCGQLVVRRERHCMCVCKGNVYVLGGSVDSGTSLISRVEVMENESAVWREAGNLEGSKCVNTCCTPLGDDDILVYGVHDAKSRFTLQVYSACSDSVTHSLSTPVGGYVWVYGIAVVSEHVVMADFSQTYTCPVHSVYKTRSRDIQCRASYLTPNCNCALVVSEDQRHILLVGGYNRDCGSPHYLYKASASDIIHDRGAGWERVGEELSLGRSVKTAGAVCSGFLPPKLMQ